MTDNNTLPDDPALLELTILQLTKKSFTNGYEQSVKETDSKNQFRAKELAILIKALDQRITTVHDELTKKYSNDKDKLDIIKHFFD